MGLILDKIEEIIETGRDIRRIEGKFVLSDKIKECTNKMIDTSKVDIDPLLVHGDVLEIYRYGYSHYAIYSGINEVIHYANPKNSTGGDFNGIIHRASGSEFLKGQSFYNIIRFYEDGEVSCSTNPEIRLYSNWETVQRAESRLGENKYNLLFNNCEHFAIWCKTGISESSQIVSLLSRGSIMVS